jgi:hypothetical protein
LVSSRDNALFGFVPEPRALCLFIWPPCSDRLPADVKGRPGRRPNGKPSDSSHFLVEPMTHSNVP